MAELQRWNKKIFAMLLDEARGERSWRQYAIDCDISYVQMRKLALGTQENPPRPKLIRKVASHALGEIGLEDFLFAAGIRASGPSSEDDSLQSDVSPIDKYRSLPPKSRRAADKFIDFLHEDAKKSQADL